MMPVISALDFTADNMVSETLPNDTPMRNFYDGKTVFLTGGTGFLGQIFVEKLLRCRVKRIFLLTRPKKNKTPSERVQETFDGVLYRKLKSIDPNYMRRIYLIQGDTMELDLGISREQRMEIIENVEIVLHAAADVRFDKSVQELCISNVRGTREVIALAEQMKKLIVFAYVSTAYSHHYRPITEEKFYSPPMDPDQMIRIAEDNREELVCITEKLIVPWKNTYVFTKALAEELIRRVVNRFPTVVIRPSIIISTHQDPIPGWTNNLYNMNGVLFGSGLGIMRVFDFDSTKQTNFICADFVTNGTLVAIWNRAENDVSFPLGNIDESKVIHHITSFDKILQGDLKEIMKKEYPKIPSIKSIWKPVLVTAGSPFLYFILTILLHILPAIMFDTYFKIKKSKLRLMPIYRKAEDLRSKVSYFSKTEWNFVDINMKTIIEKMNKHDIEFFPCDVRRFSFHAYIRDYILGLRMHISKEKLDREDDAKRKYFILSVLHSLLLTVFYSLLVGVISFIIFKKYFQS